MKITLNDLLNAKGVSEPLQGAVKALIDRLEAAESDGLEQARLNGIGAEKELALMAKLEAAEKERDALRAKIEAMEKQEPAAFALYSGWARKAVYLSEIEACEQRDRRQLTADLGGSLEAYRVVPLGVLPGAQPDPSIPEGWLRAIDEAMVVTHLGVADASDSYEVAKDKLNRLIGWHTDVATDPAVNGGYKLVPVEPTPEMKNSALGVEVYPDSRPELDCLTWGEARAIYAAMIAAAPEAKP